MTAKQSLIINHRLVVPISSTYRLLVGRINSIHVSSQHHMELGIINTVCRIAEQSNKERM
jgi:hypothetical protein